MATAFQLYHPSPVDDDESWHNETLSDQCAALHGLFSRLSVHLNSIQRNLIIVYDLIGCWAVGWTVEWWSICCPAKQPANSSELD